MLAHLIGDGSFVRNQPIRYASNDEANLAAVTEAARHFGITAIRDCLPGGSLYVVAASSALPFDPRSA